MLYVYEGCCGRTSTERRCRLAAYLEDPSHRCPECGRELKQWLTAPRVISGAAQFNPFKSPVDGSIITSESALREHNKRNGVVNIHEGYSEKSVMDMTKKDFQAPLDAERRKDLQKDMEESITKLEHGYKPETAPEGEIVP